MTFMQEEIGELEEVRQRHDAFMELGRLELMAEEIRSREADADHATGLLDSIEQRKQALSQVLDSEKS